jgi:hypothetical protein
MVFKNRGNNMSQVVDVSKCGEKQCRLIPPIAQSQHLSVQSMAGKPASEFVLFTCSGPGCQHWQPVELVISDNPEHPPISFIDREFHDDRTKYGKCGVSSRVG